ncbi:hypothetical protein [Actinoplanes sp. NPDC049681]|uniref:hypothetical protein n=1 Tax=Actinoplanes sp. NPDC049681 TaxID=3363905 RepID=UPI0037ADF162
MTTPATKTLSAHPALWWGCAVGVLTVHAMIRAVGSLLQQVQQSGSDLFGGMETLGSGLLPAPAFQRTQSLLRVWHESYVAYHPVKATILDTSRLYTVLDLILIVLYTVLLAGLIRYLRPVTAPGPAGPDERFAVLRQVAGSSAAFWLPIAAAAADLAEDGLRYWLIANAFGDGDGSAPGWVVGLSWFCTTAKFVLIALSILVVVALGHGRLVNWRQARWALWRLRVPVGAVLFFVALVLGDPTGQADDLIRRWLDSWWNALTGVAAIAGAMLLGLTVWLVTRRVVLANQSDTGSSRRHRELIMTGLWLGVLAVTAVVAILALGWHVDRNTMSILVVAVVLLLAAVFLAGTEVPTTFGKVATDWRTILGLAVLAAWVVSFAAGWPELRAPALVASVILALEGLAALGRWAADRKRDKTAPGEGAPPSGDATDAEQTEHEIAPGKPDKAVAKKAAPADVMTALRQRANTARDADVAAAGDGKLAAARRTARYLAVACPVALLVAAAGAFAPVPLVLWLSGGASSRRFFWGTVVAVLLLAGPAIVAVTGRAVMLAFDEYGSDVPEPLELGYKVLVPVIMLCAALGLIGGPAHWPGIGPISIVAAFLAVVIIALGEAQLRAETHEAPPSFLLAGFTRVPPVTLIVLTSLVAGFAFSDGSGHAVFRSGSLPAGMVAGNERPGVSLATAFTEWAAANCADSKHPDATVPMVLVSAPGGGLRAAYWTASTLTGLFGAAAAEKSSCPQAAPADRVFAVGGASGGSLGELTWMAWRAGNDTDRTWYDADLARPDFLTDPLAWLLTVDLARGYLGFRGQDRARRLENRWSDTMPGLTSNFFDGSWGQGGRLPVTLLTSTQVETGCRLNVGSVRVTDERLHASESSCTTIHENVGQTDAPAASDLLDYLCGPARGDTPSAVSRSTAALLSARFPWVSPSGQLYRCGPQVAGSTKSATRIAAVDGGYADNTGMGFLLDLWPRLERMIAAHNASPGQGRIVPVFLEVDNHYAEVAAPATPDRTVETLVPPLTKNRPDQLDDLTMRARAEAAFVGTAPGTSCQLDPLAGRYLRISPKTSPGLPAPLAWTLSEAATDDLRRQRDAALAEAVPQALSNWVSGAAAPAGC